jgi:hypothetical protein
MGVYYPDRPEYVRCIDATGSDYLTEGKLYLVLRRFNGEITIRANRGIRKPYKASRFVDVDPKDLPEPPRRVFRKARF